MEGQMGTKLTLDLSDDQVLGLIRLVAGTSMTIEDRIKCIIEVALYEADVMPTIDFEDILKDISEPKGKLRALRSVE